MTDHITADELRTAAKVAFAHDDCDNARAYERAAAKAESNIAPDPATRLAIDLGRAALEASDSVTYGSGVEAHHRAAGEAVIEFWQQNCHPLLTAGQIEDIRTVMAAAKPSGVLAHRLNTMLSLHEHVTPIAPVAIKCTICDTPELCHFPRHHPFTTELGPFDDAGNDRVSEPVADLRVHNHEPYRGAGPDGHCPERTVDGRLRGACMVPAEPDTATSSAEARAETVEWCITGADIGLDRTYAYVTVRVPKEFVSGKTIIELAANGHELAALLSPTAVDHVRGAWLTDAQAKDAEMILRMVSINHHFSEWARGRCEGISAALRPYVAGIQGPDAERVIV